MNNNCTKHNKYIKLRKKILHSSFFILHLFFFTLPSLAQENNIDGKASYYSNSLHGRRMSSGKVYHRDSLTCAHKSLPFGTKLKVTNPANGKEVVVEVADRGPYSHSRVIDLSYAAARELGIIAHGVKYVKIEILPDDTTSPYPTTSALFSKLETEYGMAGVCYEFIPEWGDEEKAVQKAESRTETTRGRTHADTGAPAKATSTGKSVGNSSTARKQQPQQQGRHKNTQKKETVKKEQSSKSWTEFFDKLKNWGGSLFE